MVATRTSSKNGAVMGRHFSLIGTKSGGGWTLLYFDGVTTHTHKGNDLTRLLGLVAEHLEPGSLVLPVKWTVCDDDVIKEMRGDP